MLEGLGAEVGNLHEDDAALGGPADGLDLTVARNVDVEVCAIRIQRDVERHRRADGDQLGGAQPQDLAELSARDRRRGQVRRRRDRVAEHLPRRHDDQRPGWTWRAIEAVLTIAAIEARLALVALVALGPWPAVDTVIAALARQALQPLQPLRPGRAYRARRAVNAVLAALALDPLDALQPLRPGRAYRARRAVDTVLAALTLRALRAGRPRGSIDARGSGGARRALRASGTRRPRRAGRTSNARCAGRALHARCTGDTLDPLRPRRSGGPRRARGPLALDVLVDLDRELLPERPGHLRQRLVRARGVGARHAANGVLVGQRLVQVERKPGARRAAVWCDYNIAWIE